MNDDRRAHLRLPIRAFAQLDSSTKEWAAHVLDISSQGVRLALLEEYSLKAGDAIQLRLDVPELHAPEGMPHHLQLKGHLVHQQEHMLGIECEPVSPLDAALLKTLLDLLNH